MVLSKQEGARRLATLALGAALSVTSLESMAGSASSVITNVWGAENCHASTATKTSFKAIAISGRKLIGKCVEVEGILHGRTIFLTNADAAKYKPRESPDQVPAQRRIGVYADDKTWLLLNRRRGVVTVVGNIGDCEELATRKGVIMVGGYCHYNDGNYIAVSEVP